MSFFSNGILISLLKQFGIKKLVLSSGSRNIPFVSAVEVDEAFECFSVVDERSAAFFALGLSQQGNEPVAIACTSGTAASNYLSGITEAFYSNAPIVVITFDRSPYALHQIETQKIDQPAIFSSVCKKSVTLPIIKDRDDIWYCTRLINEALIALRQHGTGPVHINVPLIGGQNDLVDASVNFDHAKNVRKIEYVFQDEAIWKQMAGRLQNAKRVLVVMGQTSVIDVDTKDALDCFFASSAFPLLSDNLANYKCDCTVMAEAVIKALNSKTIEKFMPEIILSFGCNFQERIKDIFKAHQGEFEHWSIDESGVVRDVFKSQTALFECSPREFFEKMNRYSGLVENGREYLDLWKEIEEHALLPEMPFSNFYTIGEFSRVIPENSLLHLSILNCTRIMQFYKLDPSIKVYSNVNAFGIDGCLPTFMGQAYATDELAFLLTGDLSFFYGMNAIAIKHRKNNIRILVINNGGGAEFHIMPDSDSIPTIDRHIGCAHDRRVKGWAESMGYTYLSAENKEDLAKTLETFVDRNHEKPVILEVFTEMRDDGQHLLSVYRHLESCVKPFV